MNTPASGSAVCGCCSSVLVEVCVLSGVVCVVGEGEEGPLIISGLSSGGRASGDCLDITGSSEDTYNVTKISRIFKIMVILSDNISDFPATYMYIHVPVCLSISSPF